MAKLPSKLQIGDKVDFTPMARHTTERMLADDIRLSGTVVAVRFTEAKTFYDVVDEYFGVVFDNIDSVKVDATIYPLELNKNRKNASSPTRTAN